MRKPKIPSEVKKKKPEEGTNVISARFDRSFLNQLDGYCKANGIKKSEFLRQSLETALTAALKSKKE